MEGGGREEEIEKEGGREGRREREKLEEKISRSDDDSNKMEYGRPEVWWRLRLAEL